MLLPLGAKISNVEQRFVDGISIWILAKFAQEPIHRIPKDVLAQHSPCPVSPENKAHCLERLVIDGLVLVLSAVGIISGSFRRRDWLGLQVLEVADRLLSLRRESIHPHSGHDDPAQRGFVLLFNLAGIVAFFRS